VAPLSNIQGLTWQNSLVCHKLQRVLWVPVEGERHIPVAERRIGTPILWEPDPQELQLLQQDWEEIMELIALGKVEKLTARHGEVPQSIAEDGSLKMTNPRGFYLKTSFTAMILNKVFG